ncbi:MAG: hypothetical protein ACHQQ3_11595 [Gemmatimonadales bacterium]
MRPLLAVAVVFVVPSLHAGAQRSLPPLPVFEGRPIALSQAQLLALSHGEPVVEVLDSHDGRVVAVFGIAAVDAERKAFIARLTNFAISLRTPAMQGFGLFATPATATNVGAFTVSPADAASLKACRPGKCEFKLPAAEMARARATLDSGASGAARLVAYARRRAADYVNTYRARGNAAMVVYDDFGTTGVRASDAFAALLAASPWLSQNAPGLLQYLQNYPLARPAGASEAIYWSVETTKGLRPTMTINHVVVLSPADRPRVTVEARKQIFASHYFEGALELLVAIDRADAPSGEGTWVIVLRQYRFDHLPEGILNIRGKAKASARERVSADLRRMQQP